MHKGWRGVGSGGNSRSALGQTQVVTYGSDGGEWETEGNCSPECCSYLEVQLGRAALYFFFVSDLAIFMAR